MVLNVNQSLNSFEESFKQFETEKLFDKKIHLQQEIGPFLQSISDIFQMMVFQYHTLISGQSIGSDPPDYEEIAKQLKHFLNHSFNRTRDEFERKLNKDRTVFADSRRQIWEERKKSHRECIETLTDSVKALKDGTEDVLRTKLQQILPKEAERIEAFRQKISQIDTSIAPLKGSKEALCTQIFQERQRWTEMIQLLDQAKTLKREVQNIGALANMFCVTGHKKRGTIQKEHLAFVSAARSLDWDVSTLESHGNTILGSFRERIKLMEELHEKYSPQMQKDIIEGKIKLQEVKKDFDHLVILIFYMRQMMDVHWDLHPLLAVQHGFNDRIPWVANFCDRATTKGDPDDSEPDGLVVFMQKVLQGKFDREETQINLQLMQNQMPEIRLTWRAKLWNFFCAIFQAIASLFKSRSTNGSE